MYDMLLTLKEFQMEERTDSIAKVIADIFNNDRAYCPDAV